MEQFAFQSDANTLIALLKIGCYSNRDHFLCELLKNASEANDKSRILQTLHGKCTELAVRIIANKNNGTLTISDDGVGMSRNELITSLGRIVRFGTKAFIEAVTTNKADVSLIDRFGVGFYSAFAVANRVSVVSRAVPDAPLYKWESDGDDGTFTIQESKEGPVNGTIVILYLRNDSLEYLEKGKIKSIVTRQTNIAHSLYLKIDKDDTLAKIHQEWDYLTTKRIGVFPILVQLFDLSTYGPQLTSLTPFILSNLCSRPPTSTSTFIQTPGDLITNESFKFLKRAIKNCLKLYCESMSYVVQGIEIQQMWANVYRFSDYIHKHSHPNSVLSGVLIVDIDSIDQNGIVEFCDPMHLIKSIHQPSLLEQNLWNENHHQIRLKKYQMLVFPSYLEHLTKRNMSETVDRISISFNASFIGDIGSPIRLSLKRG
jgi:uncharacterized protein (TIGR02466 family)